MAQVYCVRLNKGDAPSLGFRLQGGKDFGTPLVVQKVNIGSPAEKAGLLAGDSVIKINATDVYNLRHKDAQDIIIRAGPSFEIIVQRGGSTWKPAVTPLPTVSSHSFSPVTKTSLAAKPQPSIDSIGTGHNTSAKPFSPHLNGAVNGGPKLINKQYNTPLGLYSDESIAETLSAQTEVLSTGVLGVNFKKNEKNYDAANSAVFRMVQEADKEPRQQEPVNPQNYYAIHNQVEGGLETRGASNTPLSEHYDIYLGGGENTQQSGSCDQEITICNECDRAIVGVFVRIKDKNLHVECFKCATCGTSLKNVGYYNINQKLYCDIHAKLAVKSNPTATNLIPVTSLAGGKEPAGTISAALTSHSISPLVAAPPTVIPSRPKVQPFQEVTSFPSPRPFSIGTASLTPSANNYSAPKSLPVSQSTSSSTHSSGVFATTKPFSAIFKGTVGGRQSGAIGVAPKRGRGVLNVGGLIGSRTPLCGHCRTQIRGPFITALGKIWCPEHFICNTASCKRPLQDLGFVEEENKLYCEYCFEQYLAPSCTKCGLKIKGDCLKAIGKNFHPECFSCSYCGKLFGNSPFFLEDGQPYCETDWNELFTTKCFACGFPVEAGDRWVEALNNNYHSQCFNCTMCKKNLEGQSFFAKGGRPFCKNHAR